MRYPVVNLGRAYIGANPSVEASKAAMSSLAKDFQDAIDSPGKVTNQELADLERSFNEHFDNAMREGESNLDVYDSLRNSGIRQRIIDEIRPKPFWNNSTGLSVWGTKPGEPIPTTWRPPTEGGGGGGGTGTQPGGVATGYRNPTTGLTPAEEAEARASWPKDDEGYSGSGGAPGAPGYAPVATGTSSGGAHSYEEEASQYSQMQREFEEARQKSQEAADAQIKAANESAAARMQEMKEKYESGNPNAVCGPGEWWDGRSCRSVMMNRAGGLVNQAMNLGPSGAAQAVTPGLLDVNPGSLSVPNMMGRSYRVVNL